MEDLERGTKADDLQRCIGESWIVRNIDAEQGTAIISCPRLHKQTEEEIVLKFKSTIVPKIEIFTRSPVTIVAKHFVDPK